MQLNVYVPKNSQYEDLVNELAKNYDFKCSDFRIYKASKGLCIQNYRTNNLIDTKFDDESCLVL